RFAVYGGEQPGQERRARGAHLPGQTLHHDLQVPLRVSGPRCGDEPLPRPPERGGHELLLGAPTPVERRQPDAGLRRDVLDPHAVVADAVEQIEGGRQYRLVTIGAARPPAPSLPRSRLLSAHTERVSETRPSVIVAGV